VFVCLCVYMFCVYSFFVSFIFSCVCFLVFACSFIPLTAAATNRFVFVFVFVLFFILTWPWEGETVGGVLSFLGGYIVNCYLVL
jgi:hypothetical protein